jgi:hypothetical protein
MRLVADVSKLSWSIEENENDQGYGFVVFFVFRDNETLPVNFKNLSFGCSVFNKNKKVFEDFNPKNNIFYDYTDQDYLDSFLITGVFPEKEYIINVWAENDNKKWEESFPFSIKRHPSPFPSWIYNEEKSFWEAPIPHPNDNKDYIWDENSKSWIEVNNLPLEN